ncbi:MFS transporter [Agromyces chitinivorans]|uniref:MFS transporter n=1 Tax=Agromyces chitinivorans TaxID=3158560 RepID=UPI003F51A681
MTTTDTVGFGGRRGPILIALMLSTGLVAIEATILATAVPTIVADLGGFASFPWLFSAYLLAQAVTVPVYSKLADTIGRKPIILLGIGLFLVGSVLCGLAWDMGALIAFRAVQGLGAGAVMPMAVTIAGDIYTVRERAKVTGYFGSVWAASSVVGPTLGGLFAEFASWRWIFFVNIPLCLLAMWMIVRLYHEHLERREHRIDVAGAVTLTLGLTAVILGLLEGGQAWAWSSWQSLAAFGFGAVMLTAFAFVERRAAEPVLPIAILSRRLILTTSLISMGVGASLIGLTSYVPTYLEVTTGVGPIVGGLAVACISIGWPIASSQSARLYTRVGFRTTALVGLAFAMVGAAALFVTSAWPNPVSTAISCLVVGFGLGLATTPSLVAAQSAVPWHERAVVTGTNRFTRSIGSAVGVAVFGTIANAIVLASAGGAESAEAVQRASSAVFLAAFVAAVLTVGAAIAMPRVRVEDLEPPAQSPAARD